MFQLREKNTAIRYVLLALVILLTAVLQTTLIHYVRIFHVIPNLLFITVVCYGLLHGDYKPLVVGFACGLILDLMGGRAVGVNTLLCIYVAYFCLSISGSLFNHNAFVSMVFVLFLSIPYELVTYLLYFTIWGKGSFFYALFFKILPASVYNSLFVIVLYPLIKRIGGAE